MRSLNSTSKLIILLFIAVLSGCQTNNYPGEREARHFINRHFEGPTYKGYVELVEIVEMEPRKTSYMGSNFYDLRLVIEVDVSKNYVVSRHFLPDHFQVNEEWGDAFQIRMEQADSPEEQQEIKEVFNANTFSKGKHLIGVNITFSELDERWVFNNLYMQPYEDEKPVGTD